MKRLNITILILVLNLIPFGVFALELDYQIPWCEAQNGIWQGVNITVRDPFTNRVEGYVDCITKTHAVEVDFDTKWKEAPTQAMWYAMNTGKRAGILLIVSPNGTGEKKLRDYIRHYGLPIDVWTVAK